MKNFICVIVISGLSQICFGGAGGGELGVGNWTNSGLDAPRFAPGTVDPKEYTFQVREHEVTCFTPCDEVYKTNETTVQVNYEIYLQHAVNIVSGESKSTLNKLNASKSEICRIYGDLLAERPICNGDNR